MWKFEYTTTTEIRSALASARARVEKEISTARAFHTFSGRSPQLYVTYYAGMEIGPFSIMDAKSWPKTDANTLQTVLHAVLPNPSAQCVYVRLLLAAKNKEGFPVFPAGRVDVLLGRRVATEIPEDHPARKLPSQIEHKAPVVFYEDRDEIPSA